MRVCACMRHSFDSFLAHLVKPTMSAKATVTSGWCVAREAQSDASGRQAKLNLSLGAFCWRCRSAASSSTCLRHDAVQNVQGTEKRREDAYACSTRMYWALASCMCASTYLGVWRRADASIQPRIVRVCKKCASVARGLLRQAVALDPLYLDVPYPTLRPSTL